MVCSAFRDEYGVSTLDGSPGAWNIGYEEIHRSQLAKRRHHECVVRAELALGKPQDQLILGPRLDPVSEVSAPSREVAERGDTIRMGRAKQGEGSPICAFEDDASSS